MVRTIQIEIDNAHNDEVDAIVEGLNAFLSLQTKEFAIHTKFCECGRPALIFEPNVNDQYFCTECGKKVGLVK